MKGKSTLVKYKKLSIIKTVYRVERIFMIIYNRKLETNTLQTIILKQVIPKQFFLQRNGAIFS